MFVCAGHLGFAFCHSYAGHRGVNRNTYHGIIPFLHRCAYGIDVNEVKVRSPLGVLFV